MEAENGRIKNILLVDDHPLIREGLSNLIGCETDLRVVAQVADPAMALACLESQPVDLAVIDLSLKNSSGLELIKRIRNQYPEVHILVVSMHDESLYAERVLSAGAMGYVNKQEASTRVVMAIRKVLSGKIYLSERVTERSLQALSSGVDVADPPLARLSNREMEVFLLIAQGINSREISKQLHLSIKTIETHRDKIKKKLGLGSAAELNRYATLYTSGHA